MGLAGKTPLIEISFKYKGAEGSLFAKVEAFNPTGSIKDRVAEYIIEQAKKRGELKDGQPIIEVTSGNTGIAFAAVGARLGHPVHIFMPEWASDERKNLMRMFGAVLHEISREDGGFSAAFGMADRLAEEIGGYLPLQFENPDNLMAHYLGSGTEIAEALPEVTDFVSGIGTGGTLMGISRRLREKGPLTVTAIEPDSQALLTTGEIKGPHKIEGIGDDFIPKLVDTKLIDRVIDINDDDAIIMSSRLASELGLGVGISSGANFLGCVLAGAAEPGRVFATVFADDNKKYLTTRLANPPKAEPGMVSSQIELIGYRCVK